MKNKRGRPKTHGKSRTFEYRRYSRMIARCSNPNNVSYNYYGGRGVKVCERWRGKSGFESFIADMGPWPGPEYSIERIDVNGDYCPENCTWIELKLQSKNRRTNIRLTLGDKTMNLADWAKELGINQSSLSRRIFLWKWSLEKALTTPPRKHSEQKNRSRTSPA